MNSIAALFNHNPGLVILAVFTVFCVFLVLIYAFYPGGSKKKRRSSTGNMLSRSSPLAPKQVAFVIPAYKGAQAVYADSLRYFINQVFIPAMDNSAASELHRLSADKYEFVRDGIFHQTPKGSADVYVRCSFVFSGERGVDLIVQFYKYEMGRGWIRPANVDVQYTFPLKGTAADDLGGLRVQRLTVPFRQSVQ